MCDASVENILLATRDFQVALNKTCRDLVGSMAEKHNLCEGHTVEVMSTATLIQAASMLSTVLQAKLDQDFDPARHIDFQNFLHEKIGEYWGIKVITLPVPYERPNR